MVGTPKNDVARHLAVYISVIALLAGINLLTSPGDWWVQWPALGWGIGLLSHALAGSRRHEDRDEVQTSHPQRLPLPDAPEPEGDALVERAEALLRRERNAA